MIDIIKKFFGNGGRENGADTQEGGGHDLLVAICALFLEIGRIDETFTEAEMATLLSILKERYGLSQEHADALIREADRELDNSVDYWQFADLINKNYSMEEKIDIVETLWQIVFVDGRMDKYEHYLMNKLGNLLRLTHAQLMDAKVKVLHAHDHSL
jgi:uncharacterized tellurite resistance protein B-like protein